MERYKKSEDRNQLSFMPMCFDDMISTDAEVRALEVIIDRMDIRSLDFTHCETKQTGRMRLNTNIIQFLKLKNNFSSQITYKPSLLLPIIIILSPVQAAIKTA